MKVLVTGANGFVGRETVAALLAAGHQVVAGSRNGEIVSTAQALAYGDIVHADWQRLAGPAFDAIVHLAARVHQMRDKAIDPMAEFCAVNRDATLRLARAARDSGVKRFVFMSSVKAVVDMTGIRAITEDTACMPATDYGISKQEAEEALRALNSPDFEVVILRPPMVYGVEAKGNFRDLTRLIEMGVPMPLASIDNRRSLIGVRNLSSAILAALKSPPGTYFVSDGEAVSVPRMMKELGRAMHRPARLFPFPVNLLRAFCAAARQGARFSKLTASLAVSDRAFREAAGWAAPYSMAEELARLVQ